MKMTQHAAEKFAADYTMAWCSHDAAAVASFYAEDGHIVINGGEPSEGREQIAAMAQSFYDQFPDLVLRMDDVRSSGTHAVYRWTLEGTNSGPGGTGERIIVSGWEYWRFSDSGSIAESFGHFDADDYERQLEGG